MTNFFKNIFLLCLFATSVIASLDFDYMSIKPSYNAGDFMEISIIQNPETTAVGDPTVTLILYDEFGKLKLHTIFGPQPVTELPRRKPYSIEYWEIPTQISSEYEVGPRYRLRMIYSQSKKDSKEPVTTTQDHVVTIRGLKAVPGNKPNPAYKGSSVTQPGQEEDQTGPYSPVVQQPSTSEQHEPNADSIRVSDGATWAYNMVKTLLVHLLV